MLTLCDLELCVLSLDRLVDVSKHLNYNLKSIESQTVFFLRSDYGLMLTLHKLALGNFRQ